MDWSTPKIPCGSEPARDGAGEGTTIPAHLHFTDDGCALNPQNATILATFNDTARERCRQTLVPIRLGLLTLCECALCYWAAEMPLGRR
ncbi:hypothetical protein C4E44_24500 [Pseudomonas sp. MWU12-2312b]|nr:hypothetical protein C4E44_24500 [Pseudomonas sp. MWU12-2312b]